MQIEILNPAATEVRQLIALVDAYYAGLYPAESNHLESCAALKREQVIFIGGRLEGQLVACGAAKIMHDDGQYAEIKRLFVRPQFRGRGLSNSIMGWLENELRNRGIHLSRLETGVKQPEAIGLYRKLGYCERGPFGAYASDPLSLFMEKHLGENA